MPKLNIQDKLTINSSGILELNGNPYVDFNAAGQLALGNQDWLPLCGENFYVTGGTDSQGAEPSISFDYASGGMKFVGEGVTVIQTRIPVDKFSKYRIKVRVKKTVEGRSTITNPSSYTDRDFFYCGVANVNADFQEIMMDGSDLTDSPGNRNHRTDGGDQCSTYNYGVAIGQVMYEDGSATVGSASLGQGTVGSSDGEYVFENTFSGFNLESGTDHTKFDPTTSYFNIVIICNYIGLNSGNSDLVETRKGESVIQSLEVERISSWAGNSADSPADTPSYFTNYSQNYYPGLMPSAYEQHDLRGLVQMVGRGEWDANALSGNGIGRGWAFWPANGDDIPTLLIQEQKSKTPTVLGKAGNMSYQEGQVGEKRISSHNIPLWLKGSFDDGDLLIGSNHPVARFQQNYTIPGRPSPNGDYIDINIVGDAQSEFYDSVSDVDYAGMGIESGWGNLFLGARNIHKQSDGGTTFPPLETGPRNEWGMIIDLKNLVHIGIPSGVSDGNWRRMDSAYGKEVLNIHGAAKFTSMTEPRAGSGSQGAGTLWWRDDTGPGAFYYRATDGTDKVLGNGDVTFNYSGTLWEGYNADRIGTDQTVHFSTTSLNQLALNPQYYEGNSTGMALGCTWGQTDGVNRPAIQIASSANSGWAGIYINKTDVTNSNDGRWMSFGVNGSNYATFQTGGPTGQDFEIRHTDSVRINAIQGVRIADNFDNDEPWTILEVAGSRNSEGGLLNLQTSDAMGKDVGAGILFAGVADTSGAANAMFAGIHGVKNSDVSGAYGGDLVFTTRSGLAGSSGVLFDKANIAPERMRIKADGGVLIGTSEDTVPGGGPKLILASPTTWLRLEATVTDGGTFEIGSSHNQGIGKYFSVWDKDQDTHRLVVDHRGFVGINTATTPQNMLHVMGGATIESTGPVLVLKDTDGGDVNSQSGFISYRDASDTERGYVGFGSGYTKTFTVRNNIGDLDLQSSAVGGKILAGGSEIVTAANIANYGGGGGGSSPWTVNGTAIDSGTATVRTQNLEINGGVQIDNGGGTKGIWFGDSTAASTAKGYIGAGVFAINAILSNDFGISSGLGGNLAFGIAGAEKMRIDSETNTTKFLTDVEVHGELFLGPYADSTGETGAAQNKLYNISCSPFDWPQSPNPDILSQISMGCENPNQDDGVILFKTAANENQSSTDPTTGGSGDSTPRSHNLVEAMRITPQGMVGIGTASPATVLELRHKTNSELRITRDTNPGASAKVLALANSVAIGSHSNDPLYFITNNTTRMTVLPDGRVGIGSTNPQGMLDIGTETTDAAPLVIETQHPNETSIRIRNNAGGTPSSTSAWKISSRSQGDPVAPSSLSFQHGEDVPTVENQTLTLTKDQNVGIGTTTPSAKLEIVGNGESKQHVWATNDNSPGGAGMLGAYTSYGVKTFSDTAPDYSCAVGLDSTLSGTPSYRIGFRNQAFAAPIDGTLFSIKPESSIGAGDPKVQLGKMITGLGLSSGQPQQQLQLSHTSVLSLFAVGGTSAQSADNKPSTIRSFTYELPDETSSSVYAEGNSKQGSGNPDNANLITSGVGVYKNPSHSQASGYNWHTSNSKTPYYYWTSNGGHLKSSVNSTYIGTDYGQVVGDQISDERLKDIKTDFKYGLEQVLQLKPIEYSFKTEENESNKLGFGAQSTQGIIPEAVYDTGECIDGYDEDERQEGQPIARQTAKSEDTKLGMQYAQLIPVLTKAIQELKAENDDLKLRLESIEKWRGDSV